MYWSTIDPGARFARGGATLSQLATTDEEKEGIAVGPSAKRVKDVEKTVRADEGEARGESEFVGLSSVVVLDWEEREGGKNGTSGPAHTARQTLDTVTRWSALAHRMSAP